MTTASTPRDAIHWFELPVHSLDRTQPFYEQVLGVTLKREKMGGPEMAVFPGDGVHGCLMAVDGVKPTDQGALVYLNAEPSLDAALRRVESAGGRVILPRQELPEGLGCFAHVTDPEGHRVGLHAQS